jgi:hypothetical protein
MMMRGNRGKEFAFCVIGRALSAFTRYSMSQKSNICIKTFAPKKIKILKDFIFSKLFS